MTPPSAGCAARSPTLSRTPRPSPSSPRGSTVGKTSNRLEELCQSSLTTAP
jgi:hypothetical protein